jgi:hypothetical protein
MSCLFCKLPAEFFRFYSLCVLKFFFICQFRFMNGDLHEWSYDENYMGEDNLLRIMISGLAQDPPLKVVVNANGSFLNTDEAFAHDRMS